MEAFEEYQTAVARLRLLTALGAGEEAAVPSRGYAPVFDGDGDGDLDLLVIDSMGTTWLETEREPLGPELGGWGATTALGEADAGASLVVLGGRLYAIGGKDRGFFRDVFVTTPAQDGSLAGWQSTAGPTMITGPEVVAYRGAPYVVGGRNRSTVYFAQPVADGTIAGWQQTTALPEDRERHAAAAWDGRLYVAGGTDSQGTTYASVRVATVASNHTVGEWLPATDLPETRRDPATVAHDGWLWVLGGRAEADGTTQRGTVRAAPIQPDGSLGEWTEPGSLPAAVYAHTALVRGEHLYLVGGRAGATCSTAVHTARLLPGGRLGPWTPGPQLSAPRAYLGVAALDGHLYAVGGADCTANRDWAVFVPLR